VRLIDSPDSALRLAHSILEDVRSYGVSDAALDEARSLFRSRVEPALHSQFELALAEWERERASFDGRGAGWRRLPSNPTHVVGGRSKGVLALSWVAILGAAGAGYAWLTRGGESLGSTSIPGTLEFEATEGERLDFTVDTDVLFDGTGRNAKPVGCELEVTAVRDERELASVRCDAFARDATVSMTTSSERSIDDSTGLLRLVTRGQRVGCSIQIPESGSFQLRVAGSLPTCVSRFVSGTVRVTTRPKR
jgi:hypothetical protein